MYIVIQYVRRIGFLQCICPLYNTVVSSAALDVLNRLRDAYVPIEDTSAYNWHNAWLPVSAGLAPLNELSLVYDYRNQFHCGMSRIKHTCKSESLCTNTSRCNIQ